MANLPPPLTAVILAVWLEPKRISWGEMQGRVGSSEGAVAIIGRGGNGALIHAQGQSLTRHQAIAVVFEADGEGGAGLWTGRQFGLLGHDLNPGIQQRQVCQPSPLG